MFLAEVVATLESKRGSRDVTAAVTNTGTQCLTLHGVCLNPRTAAASLKNINTCLATLRLVPNFRSICLWSAEALSKGPLTQRWVRKGTAAPPPAAPPSPQFTACTHTNSYCRTLPTLVLVMLSFAGEVETAWQLMADLWKHYGSSGTRSRGAEGTPAGPPGADMHSRDFVPMPPPVPPVPAPAIAPPAPTGPGAPSTGSGKRAGAVPPGQAPGRGGPMGAVSGRPTPSSPPHAPAPTRPRSHSVGPGPARAPPSGPGRRGGSPLSRSPKGRRSPTSPGPVSASPRGGKPSPRRGPQGVQYPIPRSEVEAAVLLRAGTEGAVLRKGGTRRGVSSIVAAPEGTPSPELMEVTGDQVGASGCVGLPGGLGTRVCVGRCVWADVCVGR